MRAAAPPERFDSVQIRPAVPDDIPAILSLARGLDAWFDEHARTVAIPTDVRHQTTFVAIERDELIGFITLYVAEGRLNIGWIGVREDWHRRGAGTALVARAVQWARDLGIDTLAVATLGDSVDYEPYERTRRFYFKNGFRVTRRSRTDNPSCPEMMELSKTISPQSS
jgi:GNAT superfamily N-acetyltransferase